MALSGPSGSGKSTLAAALTNALTADAASFGRYVAHLAGLDGQSVDRRTLQDFGETAVRADPTGFVDGFLAWSNARCSKILIADGIRHVAVDDELRRWSAELGRTYVLVHVTADLDLRAARRTDGDDEALTTIDAHPVEQEATTFLPMKADVQVLPGWRVDAVVADVLAAAERASGGK